MAPPLVETERTRRELRRSLLAALVVLLLAVGLYDRIVEVCAGRMVEVGEPNGWRALPEIQSNADGSRLGDRFRFRGTTADPGSGLGSTGVVLVDPTVCESAGVGLERWFETGPPPVYSRVPSELRLREDPTSGVFTVSGKAWAGPAPPEQQTHVVSFRRELGARLSFVSPFGVAAAVVLTLAFGAALARAGLAWRRTRGR